MTRPPRPRGRHRRLNWVLRWGGVVVCAAVITLYVVNWKACQLGVHVGSGEHSLSVIAGVIGVQSRWPGPKAMNADGWDEALPGLWVYGSGMPMKHFGVWPRLQRATRSDALEYALPLWMLLALAAAPTALAWRSELRRRRRERIKHCTKCGYDLAGLGVNAACPECGVIASSPQSGPGE